MIAMAAPLDLSQWRYRKRIALTPGDGLAVVKLDREVYIGSRAEAADLRVVRDGQEVPFVLRTAAAPDSLDLVEQPLLDRSVVAEGLQFVVHLKRPGRHNSIFINTDEKNFRQRVRIETSQDGVKWAVARNDGAIFNFSQDGREFSSTVVEYPVSTRPYLRVTVFGWTKTSMATSASVNQHEQQPVAYEVFAALTPQVWEDAPTKSTVVAIDQGVTGLPISRIRIETSAPQFQRAVMVETSDDGKSWRQLKQDVIARLPGAEFTEESLVVHSWGARRYLRLHIYNRDDQPLPIGRIQLEGIVDQLRFLAPAPGAYWLYYGNASATALPEYDLNAVLDRRSLVETSWPMRPSEVNPAYRPPPVPKKPWSEQHPAILYTVLGGAVLALGIATFRFAARLRPSSTS